MKHKCIVQNAEKKMIMIINSVTNVEQTCKRNRLCRKQKKQTQKQSKLKLVIPIVLVVCVGLAVLLFGSGDKYVKAVQEGNFLDYPQATVGEVVDTLLSDAEWESEDRSEKEKAVVVRGNSETSSYRIEFIVDKDASNWKLNGIVKDSQLCSSWQETLELEKWYVAYAKEHPDKSQWKA